MPTVQPQPVPDALKGLKHVRRFKIVEGLDGRPTLIIKGRSTWDAEHVRELRGKIAAHLASMDAAGETGARADRKRARLADVDAELAKVLAWLTAGAQPAPR